MNMKLFFQPLMPNLFNDGGPLFMYVTLLLLLVVIGLFIMNILKKTETSRSISLISSVSLFALVWGFLGQLVGLIGAFDSIESYDNISPAILAGGIKVSILSPAFGMVVFLIARIAIIILQLKKKNQAT